MAVDLASSAVDLVRWLCQQWPRPCLLRQYEATEQDYESLSHEDLKCEFIDGVLIVHSPATFSHEDRVAFLITLLRNFVSSRSLGWVCGSNTVIQLGHRRFCPDVCFLASDHADRVREERIIGPADLVAEMLSKSTRDYDLAEKRAAYHEGRVPEVWLIDPELRQFHVDVLAGDAYEHTTLPTGSFASAALPGLAVHVDWFWTDPLPNPLECLNMNSGE
jgi:Uma2 family endonuclease